MTTNMINRCLATLCALGKQMCSFHYIWSLFCSPRLHLCD